MTDKKDSKGNGDDRDPRTGRFVLGHHGGPGSPPGVPKGSAVKEWIKDVSAQVESGTGKTFGELFARRLAQIALEGKGLTATKALEIIFDRTEPKSQGTSVTIVNHQPAYLTSLEDLRQRLISSSK
jgi:hypothetical protein